ncbi:aspartate/glutamate racemase family protein [Micromonospora sp. WMMC273]|uniref:aspartate/glutamate racemase family protein n=1 Tax=Micromonospora sp. WMMC273 TaxID=3015157 RepID=UPI0022B71AE2|nr:aspartate/glutamate racemase family protein [Micromonospora sp. WMMC273]MCZ7474984.1 aspartate/glutamate racemase family protein [Micromonospora sp. WMMC273]
MNDRPEIGVLCLDTSFDKIPGHIRNPDTFDFPVRYRVVEGATPQRLVREADPTLLRPFVDAARDLEAAGVAGITGACGFLVLFQAELATAVRVPLWSSSLVQLPMVHRMVGRPVGLLVADEAALTPRHLAAIGAADVPVAVTGMAGQPEFREVMLEGRRDALDVERLAAEVDERVDAVAAAHPDLGALVVECTDLVPFAHRIQARLGVPVFDIVTLTTMAYASLTRGPYHRKQRGPQ